MSFHMEKPLKMDEAKQEQKGTNFVKHLGSNSKIVSIIIC